MARYRTLDVRLWADEKFARLSAPPPNAQGLWIYLLTGEHTGPLPGLSRVGEHALAEALGWPLPAFRRCWAEIAGQRMAAADWQRRVVWVPNRIAYAPPANTNVILSWRAAWDELPECPIKIAAWHVYHDNMSQRDAALRARAEAKGLTPPAQPFMAAFVHACPNPEAHGHGSRRVRPQPFAKPFAKPFGEPLPEPSAIRHGDVQEQEQEVQIKIPAAGEPPRSAHPAIRRIVHGLLDAQAYATEADLKADVKAACARAHVPYDASAVRIALDGVQAQRRRRAGA